jgi:hypothetical protein
VSWVPDAGPADVALAEVLDEAVFTSGAEVGAAGVVERCRVVEVADEVVVAGGQEREVHGAVGVCSEFGEVGPGLGCETTRRTIDSIVTSSLKQGKSTEIDATTRTASPSSISPIYQTPRKTPLGNCT